MVLCRLSRSSPGDAGVEQAGAGKAIWVQPTLIAEIELRGRRTNARHAGHESGRTMQKSFASTSGQRNMR